MMIVKKILTAEIVNEHAKQLAAATGVEWMRLPTEAQAKRQGEFVTRAVYALYARGYVNQKIKAAA